MAKVIQDYPGFDVVLHADRFDLHCAVHRLSLVYLRLCNAWSFITCDTNADLKIYVYY